MSEITALSNFIIAYRKKHRESQEDFASNCDISKDTLSLIERGEANPRLDTMQKIAAYTGVTVAEMLTVQEYV